MTVVAPQTVRAQTGVSFNSYEAFKDSLVALTQITDALERDAQLTEFFTDLQTQGQIPYTYGESVAFLYRGPGSTIQFAGDFNGWNPRDGNSILMAPSDVWIREESFPGDARLDYKIVRNANDWILDPDNPLKQRGGFGDNSELRMPMYIPSPWVDRQPGIPAGTYSSNFSIISSNLGYTVRYRVYTPAAYDSDQLSNLPVIYVTDGHETAADPTGSMLIVLDNLIDAERIPPVVAVFIDPRVGGNNLRFSQYIENDAFADFVADELVPLIDASYRTDPSREARAILGTSLGGLNSAFFGATRTDTFALLGVQSPAFKAGNNMYDLYRNEPVRDVRIHMSWGTIHDVGDAGEKMAEILSDKGYEFETVILNEGHSWGAWRALLDDVLVYFWGLEIVVGTTAIPERRQPSLGQNYPNPAEIETIIPFSIPENALVRLRLYDILGRLVTTLINEVCTSGDYEVAIQTANLPSGAYIYRLELDGNSVADRTLVLLR